MLNIGGSLDDPFYRYQMPALEVMIKGGKTELNNLQQIATELERPVEFLCAYLRQELNCAISNKKNKIVASGVHGQKDLQALITNLVEKYVVCGACGNPETHLDKKGRMTCRCCGSIGTVELTGGLSKSL